MTSISTYVSNAGMILIFSMPMKVDHRIAQSKKPQKATNDDPLYSVAEYQDEIKFLLEMKSLEATKETLDTKELPSIRSNLEEKEIARPELVQKVQLVSRERSTMMHRVS